MDRYPYRINSVSTWGEIFIIALVGLPCCQRKALGYRHTKDDTQRELKFLITKSNGMMRQSCWSLACEGKTVKEDPCDSRLKLYTYPPKIDFSLNNENYSPEEFLEKKRKEAKEINFSEEVIDLEDDTIDWDAVKDPVRQSNPLPINPVHQSDPSPIDVDDFSSWHEPTPIDVEDDTMVPRLTITPPNDLSKSSSEGSGQNSRSSYSEPSKTPTDSENSSVALFGRMDFGGSGDSTPESSSTHFNKFSYRVENGRKKIRSSTIHQISDVDGFKAKKDAEREEKKQIDRERLFEERSRESGVFEERIKKPPRKKKGEGKNKEVVVESTINFTTELEKRKRERDAKEMVKDDSDVEYVFE